MLHSIKTTQLVKADINKLWLFISSPKNLSKITPIQMGFEIISDEKDIEKMYAGQLIEYNIKPLLGLKMRWVTEITHFENLHYFVDEQRFGPYLFWHHKHFLKEVKGGVEMIDIVHYKLPFGIFGEILHSLFIKNKLKEIFDYRYKKIEELFNN